MKAVWRPLLWRLLPKDVKARLAYTEQLATDMFVSLPVATKRAFIRHAQSVLGYETFIETGTFLGDMAGYASHLFQRVHTIELSPDLARRAVARFAAVPHVTVHEGDSGQILPDLLATINSSCLFWLDGHYSGGITARGKRDTPIAAELEAIAGHPIGPHAVLIDDARVFGTDAAYPVLEEVFALLRAIDPTFRIAVSSDIIWAAPVRLLEFEWRVSPSGVVVPPSTMPFDPAGIGARRAA
jgi:hypothetical protein